ncbi:hypothetical protein VSS86_22450, partial [Bacillus safensis]|nr:hypothetical protein [Bacillus safensis]
MHQRILPSSRSQRPRQHPSVRSHYGALALRPPGPAAGTKSASLLLGPVARNVTKIEPDVTATAPAQMAAHRE